MTKITVEKLLTGTLVREGAGVKLHRYIGVDRRNDFEPFLLFDYFDSQDPIDFQAGFPNHPHRGFETITYVFQGSIVHADNQGHKGVIGPGDVQWMTAGSGIIHSEMPDATLGQLTGLQLWLNLPAKDKLTKPRYQEILSNQFPVESHSDGVSIKVIAGITDDGTNAPVFDIATHPVFFDITLPRGTQLRQSIPKDYQSLLFVYRGSVQVGEGEIDQGVLASLSDGDSLIIEALEDSQCLLLSAMRLHEPIARHGPFVMNTQEEIVQAIDDFRSNRF